MKNPKIITGIYSKEELKSLINLSDSFYFGLKSIKNHRSFNHKYNLSINQAKKIIELAKKNKKEIYLATNEIYKFDELEKNYKIIRKLISSGLDGVILKDITLIKLLKPYTYIIVTSTACLFNHLSIELYEKLGANRIILPQQIDFDDAKNIIKRFPQLEFEVFFLPDSYCANIDGLCLFHDLISKKVSICKIPFILDNKKLLMKIPEKEKRYALLKNYISIGIKYIKIPRDGSLEQKIENIIELKKIINGKGNYI